MRRAAALAASIRGHDGAYDQRPLFDGATPIDGLPKNLGGRGGPLSSTLRRLLRPGPAESSGAAAPAYLPPPTRKFFGLSPRTQTVRSLLPDLSGEADDAPNDDAQELPPPPALSISEELALALHSA